MKSNLGELIDQALREYFKRKNIPQPENFNYDLVASKEAGHGDFSCNAAFKISKSVRERPALVADEIVMLLESQDRHRECEQLIERMEVAGGGFINFYLTRASFAQLIQEIVKKGDRYGESDFGKGRKVLLEFVSANPTGPLTIAHGRQAAVGDTLANILRATGHEIDREYYLNDSGRQMNLLGQSLWVRYRNLLGDNLPLPEDGYRGDYLVDIAQKLFQLQKDAWLKLPEDEAQRRCMRFAADEIMTGIKADLAQIGVKMDRYFSEGTLYQSNEVEKTLELLKNKGHLYEQDGALWFRSTAFGDDKDRVVKKSTGEATYLAPDIAYHRDKFERGFNWLINFLGPDHHGYISRLKAACQALGHDAREIEVRIVQLTTLYRNGEPVRMSTRAGEFVTLAELVREVGADAARFFFVMRRIESHLDFDLELAKQKSQDNPVYYLQYAYARIASLLRYAGGKINPKARFDLLVSAEETTLMKQMTEFPKALIQASQMLEPYRLAEYLRELATSFHKFYAAHRVVNENEELTEARILLVESVRIVLRNGLRLLGIAQPESM